MPSKSRMESPARKDPSSGVPKSIGKKAPSPHRMNPTGLESVHQAYGNQAAQRLVRTMLDEHSSKAALGLKPPYRSMAQRLENEAHQAGKTELLRLFILLTSAQKLAVLRELGGAQQAEPFEWKRLENTIQSMQKVKLAENEPEAEADIRETGAASRETGSIDVTGLLAPYKDIVLWLNYKANKQGKTALMRVFQGLSIPQKKIALHKMSKLKKLEFHAFSEAVTIQIQQKQWIDWDAFTKATKSAEKIKVIDPDLDPADYAGIAPTEEHDRDEAEDEEDEGLDISGLLLAAALTSRSRTKAKSLRKK
jgi:hypothetical protein